MTRAVAQLVALGLAAVSGALVAVGVGEAIRQDRMRRLVSEVEA